MEVWEAIQMKRAVWQSKPHPISDDAVISIMFEAGQAAAYMQLAAWELGVTSCLATIYKYNEARELLGLPDDLHTRIAISFGYPQNEEELSRSPQKTGRRILSEVVHYDKW